MLIQNLLLKLLAERIKKGLPSLMSKTQITYFKRRCISKGGKLISDVLKIFG